MNAAEGCEEAEIRLVGRSYFVKLRSGGSAFIPVDKICEALVRYDICPTEELMIKCREVIKEILGGNNAKQPS